MIVVNILGDVLFILKKENINVVCMIFDICVGDGAAGATVARGEFCGVVEAWARGEFGDGGGAADVTSIMIVKCPICQMSMSNVNVKCQCQMSNVKCPMSNVQIVKCPILCTIHSQ